MKKLVQSQETYIKELEAKLSENDINPNEQTGEAHVEQNEEQVKANIIDFVVVKKNQVQAEEEAEKLKLRETELREEFEEKELEFAKKQKYLESENRVLMGLKTEIKDKNLTTDKDRAKFHKTLRNMLLEEIDRIEGEQAQRVKEMEQWRENFEADAGGEQEELQNRINELESEKSKLGESLRQLEEESQKKEAELEERISYLNQSKSKLTQQTKEVTREYQQLQTNVNTAKKTSTKDEAKWESEKQNLYDQLSRSNVVLEEKESLREQQIQQLDDGYKITIQVQDKRIQMLNKEKKLADQQYEIREQDLNEKHDSHAKENEELRNINSYMIKTFEEREEVISTGVTQMRDEIAQLQNSYDQREGIFVHETQQYTEKVQILHSLLEKAQEKLEAGWDPSKTVSDGFRDQIQTLEGQLTNKDQIMVDLREQVIVAQNEQRTSITEKVGEFTTYLTHMSDIEQQTESKYEEFLSERIENDRVSNSRELSDSEKITELSTEINNLRFQVRELHANNKEKEFADQKIEFVKCETDLQHAKSNLMSYIQSFEALQEKFMAKTGEFDETDEIARLKLENIRLHEENSSLVDSKQKNASELNSRIETLTSDLFVKTEEYDQLQAKYSNLLNTLNSNREEEIKSWIRR